MPAPIIKGYALVFGVVSRDLGGFREVIHKGAFQETLADGWPIQARINHDRCHVLATVADGSLSLRETPVGLYFEIRPDLSDPWIARYVRQIRRGEATGISIRFSPEHINWKRDPPSGCRVRHVYDLNLHEISVVIKPGRPAYPRTAVWWSEPLERFKRELAKRRAELSPIPGGGLKTWR